MSARGSVVWVSPRATTFSCLCERCLDVHVRGESFLEAVRRASVRGELQPEADVGFAHCAAGHEVIVRRNAPLPRPDTRQLQLV